ncbi:unnamed protein product, partial [Polarella glacialis]
AAAACAASVFAAAGAAPSITASPSTARTPRQPIRPVSITDSAVSSQHSEPLSGSASRDQLMERLQGIARPQTSGFEVTLKEPLRAFIGSRDATPVQSGYSSPSSAAAARRRRPPSSREGEATDGLQCDWDAAMPRMHDAGLL